MNELSTDEITKISGCGSLHNFSGWLADNLDRFSGAQSKVNYREYRRKRDSSNDKAARERSRSRSDMNSPGDQRSSDNIGGR